MKFYKALANAIRLYGQLNRKLNLLDFYSNEREEILLACNEFDKLVLTGQVDYKDWTQKYINLV